MKLPAIFCIITISVLITSCSTEPTVIEYFGCTNPDACNYDPRASLDNGTCDLITCNRILGCVDEEACNFDPEANTNDNSCEYSSCGCTDSEARNYKPSAIVDNGSCDYRCTKRGFIDQIILREAPVQSGMIKFEIWVDGELAVQTHSQQFEKGNSISYDPEDFIFNREGNNKLVEFSGEQDGVFSLRVFINDVLSMSTEYNACYTVSINSDTILSNLYFVGGFECRNQPCDFVAFLFFRSVEL